MATKNIVPRADNEGQIGTAAKKWTRVVTTDLTLGAQAVSQAGKDLIDDADVAAQRATIGAEAVANKSTSVPTDAASDTKYPSVKAVKDYADGLVTGLLDYRGAYNASGNTYPTTGGSGTVGAVMKGDMWLISVAGVLGTVAIQVGDMIIANIDTPAQTAANWNTLNTNVSYIPEDSANKENTALDTSAVKYPSNAIVKTAVDGKAPTSHAHALTDLAVQAAETVDGNPTATPASPTAITVTEQTVLGRITGGHVKPLSIAELITLLGLGSMAVKTDTDYVAKALFDAYTILMATDDNTPAPLTVTEQTLVGRKTGGAIAALTGADVLLAMGISATTIAELGYVHGVTSGIQAQLDDKKPATVSSRMATIENDCMQVGSVAIWAPLLGTAIASGTILPTAGSANRPGQVYFRNSTSPNSGYLIATNADSLLLAGGETAEFVFVPLAAATTTIRFGFHDSVDQNEPTDGVWISIIGDELAGYAKNNAGPTVTATHYHVTGTLAYRVRIALNANATLATFTLFLCSNDSQLWTDTVDANIPTGAGRRCGFAMIATTSATAAAAELCDLDWYRFSCSRVLVR